MMSDLLAFLSDAEQRRQLLANALASTNRGVVAGTLGAPVDMANTLLNIGKAGVGYVGHKTGLLSPSQMPVIDEKPVGGSEWIGDKMQRMGLLNDYRNPTAEALAGGLLAPAASAAVQARAPQIARGLLQIQENAAAPSDMARQGQRGMAAIRFKKGDWKDKPAVLPDGTVEFPMPSAAQRPLHEYRDKALELAWDKYAPKYEGFFRFTNNPDEPALVASGSMRKSMNHADGTPEIGVSVATGPHYGIQGYKHGYRVQGEVVGYGSDGEPLLNPKTMQVLSELAPSHELVKADRALQKKILRDAGLPDDYFTNFNFLNKPDDLWR